MTKPINAVFRDGVFVPAEPTGLANGTPVELVVGPVPDPDQRDLAERFREATTFAAAYAIYFQMQPKPAFSFLHALNENRRRAGLPPLTSLHEKETVADGDPAVAEIHKRMRAAKTFAEFFDLVDQLPPDPPGYNLLRALNENRRRAGRPLLYTPEEEAAG